MKFTGIALSAGALLLAGQAAAMPTARSQLASILVGRDTSSCVSCDDLYATKCVGGRMSSCIQSPATQEQCWVPYLTTC